MKRIPTLTLGLAAMTALALAGCTSASDVQDGAANASAIPSYDTSSITKQDDIAALLPDSVTADGVLTAGASTDYAPAEFRDPSGNPVGYDVDLTRAIAAVLGLDAKTEHAEFDSIIPAVGTKFDLGISSFTITPERLESVTMVSYINVGSQFNVAKGNPEGVDPSDTLNLCGLTIGVQTGTSQESAIKGYSTACTAAGKPVIDVKPYSAQSDATTALAGGALDATFADSTVAGYAQIQTEGKVETVGEVIDAAPQGVVVAKGDTATAEAVRQAIQYLMDEGYWDEILETWGIDTSQALKTSEIDPSV
ncbi:ABC transporter substrate-binding protein [Actinomyces oricola]